MPSQSSSKRRRERGVALVVVLAFVVLLSGLVVAYFSRVAANRQLSSSSFNQSKADELARSALDIITSDLKQEIVNGSSASGSGNATIYTATSNRCLAPQRNVNNSAIPTLLRISATAGVPAPGVDFCLASNASSTGSSANGRSITPARWNQHYLIPRDPAKYGGTKANNVGTDPLPSFLAPSWIFVTGTGLTVLASPTNSVMGRYAYAIYDEGALLDINVAGYPFNTTPAQAGEKGSLAFADLTVVGFPDTPAYNPKQIDRIVGWRNYASAKPSPSPVNGKIPAFSFDATAATNYYHFVVSNTTGFLKVSGTVSPDGRTDQAFLSRQQLLEFRNSSGFSQDILQYLGTFSRAVTAPSGVPATPLRFSNTGIIAHFNDDGTLVPYPVQSGDFFLQRRFSLAKLAWLTHSGPASGKEDAIQACFGLKWNASNTTGSPRWDYVGSSGSTTQATIKTLDQVAQESPAREPNFFELLKAGILSGSLGKHPGAAANGPFIENTPTRDVEGPLGCDFESYSAVSDFQVIQIGANIIDQSDTDNFPTAIYLNFTPPKNYPEGELYKTAFGIENLPYLTRMGVLTAVTQDGAMQTEGTWLQPELWNPHQNPYPSYPGSVAPSQLRLITLGGCHALNTVDPQGAKNPGDAVAFGYDPAHPADIGQIIITNSSAFFNNPVALTGTHANSPSSQNSWSSAGSVVPFSANPFVAVHAGDVERVKPAVSSSNSIRICPDPYLTFVLQYNEGSNWFPYSMMARINQLGTQSFPSSQSNGDPAWKEFVARPDPRTDRFSVCEGEAQGTAAPSLWPMNQTMRWSNGATNYATVFCGYPRPGAGFYYGTCTSGTPSASSGTNSLCFDQWAENLPSSTSTYYSDPDGIVRPGDSYRANTSSSTGYGMMLYHQDQPPKVADSQGRRPTILNRPFRSVGELGYVFRDLPFKTLDFWSDKSADAVLLELFSTTDEPPVVAGQVNPANAPALVLQAILVGTMKNEASTLTLGSADAQKMAAQLAGQCNASPLQTRADLVPTLSKAIDAQLTAIPDLANKAYGEASLRALAPVLNLRTWNLMIDVIAQTGMFPANAKTLDHFVVQGERRYWLHIAIDRLTGKVVDQQLEPVYE